MYLMQTVSTGPSNRSFQHVNNPKDLDEIIVMNSTEDISKYSDGNSHYRSPTLARRATDLDDSVPEKVVKKDKKWSLGGFFRRRKKEVESESTSDEETTPKRGFLQRRRLKKEDKKKKRPSKAVGTFDHVVVAPVLYGGTQNGARLSKDDESGGVFSEPSIGFASNIGRTSKALSNSMGSSEILIRGSRESLSKTRSELSNSRGSLQGSLDSSGKKSRRQKVKARVEALRDNMKNDSSSDEGSQKSTASSITRFKSDDSLGKNNNGSISRKSRSARTERYMKRLTKEDETVLNKEAEQRTSKTDLDATPNKPQINRWIVVDEVQKAPQILKNPAPKSAIGYSPSAPLPQNRFTGISTIPPSHILHRAHSNFSDNQRNIYYHQSPFQNAIVHPSERNPQRNELRRDFLPDQRSVSYDCNINRSPTPVTEGDILHVHLPLGKPVPKPRNPSLISSNQSLQRATPPPPPPRDPQRRIYTNFQYEGSRPMSYAFENGNQRRTSSGQSAIIDRNSVIKSNYALPNKNVNRSSSFGWQPNYRSNSEDHIAQINQYNVVQTRPASATPDMSQQRFIRRHPRNEQYHYFAEKTPRSRKPIHIHTAAPQPDQTYLSDSQITARNSSIVKNPVNAASEFWKQKDLEETKRKSQMIEPSSKVLKPDQEIKKKFSVISIPLKTCEPYYSPANSSEKNTVYAKPFIQPSNDQIKNMNKSVEKQDTQNIIVKPDPPLPPVRVSSRQGSGSSAENNWMNDSEDSEKIKRRSTNLEDALDELEAIYKSLRLGDEDLLDRAERRDVHPSLAHKLLAKAPEPFSKWTSSRGAQSDSGFNYDMDTVDSVPKKRPIKRIPDKINDDMAYRRLCKDRNTSSESTVPQVSYLLTSPLLGNLSSDEFSDNINKNDEPDITLDDVVYRNLKHANNSLKVVDPQPLFGIPLGPITAAPNSDYLHAVPEDRPRLRFKPHKSPDIVKDDLAYRSLRKDSSKDPTLPVLGPDDYLNNNSPKEADSSSKKKRAVRSMSANINNIMGKHVSDSENEFDKAQSLTDIADAMEIAHKILKERASKGMVYNKSTKSDGESKNSMRTTTQGSFVPTSTETLTGSRNNLNETNESSSSLQQKLQVYIPLSADELNVNQKPPLCPTPDRKSSKPATKESTPNRISPDLEDEKSFDKSQLEELLTALAIEARETSEKLGNDLRLLDEENSRKCTPKISRSTTPNHDDNSKPLLKSTNEKLSDIDAVSEHAKLCEKLLECVVESTELISPKIPEVNENKETELTEEVNDLPTEPSIYKSVANIIVTRKADIPQPADPRLELYSESDHDYDNVQDKNQENALDEELTILQELDNCIKSSDELGESTTEELCDERTVLENPIQQNSTETFTKIQGEPCMEGYV